MEYFAGKSSNMKKIVLLTMILSLNTLVILAQATEVVPVAPSVDQIAKSSMGIVISTNDAETVWNAFRLANFAVNEGENVSVFLLGKGVEAPELKDAEFDVKDQMTSFTENGGKIMACGTCLRSRKSEETKLCPISTMAELFDMIKKSDKVLTF
jgi:uncharacterized protein involved in oxidation of intracellular sulfur